MEKSKEKTVKMLYYQYVQSFFKLNIIKDNSLIALLNNAVFIFGKTNQESWL